MKLKRFFCILMCLALIISAVPFSVSARETELTPSGEAPVYYIETYEQLKNHASTAQADCRYILNADIEQVDNQNENEIVVASGATFNLDLNGYSIKRSTTGNDCALFRIRSDGRMTIKDTSDAQTGYCSFSEGFASYSKAVFYNDGGELEIYSGYYEIFSPYEQGDCSVVRTMSGYTNIYDGTFDASASWGGHTITVGHNAYMYEVPQVVIFGGDFYGKYSSIEVSPMDNYLDEGCLFPNVYVLGGNFYVTKESESAGFAYCNNGWGRVIVAEGVVLSKCLNARDQRFLSGTSKKYFTETIDDYTAGYYEVTAPPMIISESLDYYYRLIGLCDKEMVKSYGNSVYELHKDKFDEIMDRMDTIMVSETETEAPCIELYNRTKDHVYVNWYKCTMDEYKGDKTQWTYLGDLDNISQWQFDERPEDGTDFIIRCVVTNSDLSTYEDVVRISFAPLKKDTEISSVEVKDVDTPVVGQTPDFDVTAEDSFYINGIYWTDATDPKNRFTMKETDTFEAGHTYELEVWIRANEGYKFRTDSDGWLDIAATVGGKDAEVILPGSSISAELLLTFTVSENADLPTNPSEPSEPSDSTEPAVKGILGDANEDTKVNIKDATAIQKHVASLITLSETGAVLADVDENGNVNIKDATAIQKHVAGMETSYPIAKPVA